MTNDTTVHREQTDLDERFFQRFSQRNGDGNKETMLSDMRAVGFIGDLGGHRARLIEKYHLFGDTQPRQKPTHPRPQRKKRKEPSPAAQRCKATIGFSLDYPNITPNAIPLLSTFSVLKPNALALGYRTALLN